MQVRVICGAQSAYACIQTPTTSLDMMLSPGRSAPQSLRESAAELRERAAQLLERAALLEAAAEVLAAQPGST